MLSSTGAAAASARRCSIAVFPNHPLYLSPARVILPRAEADFVSELGGWFGRVYLVGLCRTDEPLGSFDGAVALGDGLQVIPLGITARHEERLTPARTWRFMRGVKRLPGAGALADCSYFFVPSYINLVGALFALAQRRKIALYVRGEWYGYPPLYRFGFRFAARRAACLIVTGAEFRKRLLPLNPSVQLVRPMTSFTLRAEWDLNRTYRRADPITVL